ncbi:MAG TPA: polysaccharide deacetylase family protein [Pyrinomonadaceae bacterium]|jgi:peptidoglycan/xylan/chitin deacetylase (PgdA/CDA1 family)
MKSFFTLFFLILISSLVSIKAQKANRFIAVTIDDLPVVSKQKDLKVRQEITRKLLGHIKKAKIPAIGFVNEGKLYANEKRVETEVDLLRQWLDAGLELGNHTRSHMNLHANPLEKYTEDILKGETVTKELLASKNKQIRYFRHPYLFTGLDLETKQKLGAFLAVNNYTIAPVTIDNADWIFARAYDNALEKNDKKLMKQIGDAYVPYLAAKMDYWERQSIKLFNREPKQILLLHANSINADYFHNVAEMLKKRGYQFVTLENALTDEVYKLPDTFTKRAGISWLHRWALDKGRENVLPNEPKTPDFVLKAAGVDSE